MFDNYRVTEVRMKRIILFAALAVGLTLFSTGCSSNVSDDSSDTSSETTTTSSVLQSDLYGSYWGTMTMGSTTYDLCFVASESSVVLYSTMSNYSYTNIVYSESDGTWTVSAYHTDADTSTATASVAGTFTVSDDSYTCVVTMGGGYHVTDMLTRGDTYDGEYGTDVTSY